MPTTKKVAPKKSTQKKTAKVVSVPLKKSKTVVKKVKTVAKKTSIVKKSVLKTKKLPQQKNPKLLIQDNTKSKHLPKTEKGIDNKFKTIESLHAKHLVGVDAKAKLISSKIKKVKPSLELALLAPYRFPINSDMFAVKAARYGGMFFAISGAAFTLFFAQASFSPQTQLASLASSVDTKTVSTTIDCNNSLQYLSTSCASVVDQTPDIVFEFEKSEVLVDTVKIKAKVEHADRVIFTAYYKTQNQELEFGAMTKVSDNTWELYLDTQKLDDGEYKFKALVQNGYGAYEVLDTQYITIENNPIVSPTNVSTEHPADSEGAQTDTSTESVTTAEKVTTTVATSSGNTETLLTVSTIENSVKYLFDIVAKNANKVKLSAHKVGDEANTTLGYAYKSSSSLWKYQWLTSNVAAGDYVVTALIMTDSGETVTNAVSVTKTVGSTTTLKSSLETDRGVVSVDPKNLKPPIELSVQAEAPVANVVSVKIDVNYAALVEIYAQQRNSLTKKYLGVAKLVDTDTWLYTWDTKQTPNGEYALVAVVKNSYGTYEDKSEYINISNVVADAYTPKQEARIDTLKEIATEVNDADATEKNVALKKELGAEVLNGDEELSDTVDAFETGIKSELNNLALALRLNDTDSIGRVTATIEKMKQQTLLNNSDAANSQLLMKELDSVISVQKSRIEEDVTYSSKIIVERTKEKASVDSDSDGVSDYDEVVIFKTNPFVADTDSDGFVDGAEILGGYNPLDPSSEVLMTYESPQDAGIVREDILEVHSVITALKNDIIDEPPQALISGRALPNSFVTLYIFSTPVVVTVKTDADGAWNYRFDKELEDGEHQVYVGVTDNAGKIIAKSNPFVFVKKAEAFDAKSTAAAVSPAIVSNSETSFLSEYMVYLVLSISVVAIGLVLILLGLYLDSSKRKYAMLDEEANVAV